MEKKSKNISKICGFGCEMTKIVEKKFTTMGTYFINIDINLVF
jgi:hypothetical protein